MQQWSFLSCLFSYLLFKPLFIHACNDQCHYSLEQEGKNKLRETQSTYCTYLHYISSLLLEEKLFRILGWDEASIWDWNESFIFSHVFATQKNQQRRVLLVSFLSEFATFISFHSSSNRIMRIHPDRFLTWLESKLFHKVENPFRDLRRRGDTHHLTIFNTLLGFADWRKTLWTDGKEE
jgi:hypothetical protein